MQIRNEKPRLEFLDCLRFFAALAVIIQHVFERVSPTFGWFCSNYFQFGAYGVTLFFLTSGFIIPVSLEKYRSLKKFWTGRIFRLYPLFFLSLILKLTYLLITGSKSVDITAITILGNISMLAKFMGIPLIEGLYWTLNLEMAFYISVSGLFLIGMLQRSLLLAYCALGLSVVVGVVFSGILHLFDSGWMLVIYFATMFVGTVFYRCMKGVVTVNALLGVIAVTLCVLFANTYLNLYNIGDIGEFGSKGFWPVTNALFGAYLTFSIFYCFRKRSYPKQFVYFGAISYSLYLNQAIIIAVIMSNVQNIYLSTVLAILLIFIMSHYTYTFVELPFVKLGRKLTAPKAKMEPNGFFGSSHPSQIAPEQADIQGPV